MSPPQSYASSAIDAPLILPMVVMRTGHHLVPEQMVASGHPEASHPETLPSGVRPLADQGALVPARRLILVVETAARCRRVAASSRPARGSRGTPARSGC